MMLSINTQVRIKRKLFALHASLVLIQTTGAHFRHAVQKFLTQENINISGEVERYLPIFYRNIAKATKQNNALYRTLRNTQFRELIDFAHLESYIKQQFNTPISDMITLLSQMHEKISHQQKALTSLSGWSGSNFSENLQLKHTTLEHQDNLILSHIGQLKKALL